MEIRGNVLEKVVEKEAFVYPISAGFIDKKSVGDTPEHDGLECEQGGCKSKERVTRYMERTAGLLTAVRPCGIIVKAQEMYKELCCMPPDNPKCCYLPHLETFRKIRGTNTESAEQVSRFLDRFKHSVQ